MNFANNKNTKIAVGVSLILVLVGGYYVFKNSSNLIPSTRKQTPRRPVSQLSVEDKQYLFPFYINDKDYDDAYMLFSEANKEYLQKGTVGDLYIDSAYKALVKFAEIAQNKKLDPKERGYALNMLNYMYIALNWDTAPFVKFFSTNTDPEFGGNYAKNKKSFEAIVVNKGADPLRNNNNVVESLAVQQTMVDLNKLAYQIYPNPWSHLRVFLNQSQIIGRLIDKDVVGTQGNYIDYVRSHYTMADIQPALDEVEAFKSSGHLYDGVAGLGFQLHMMSAVHYDLLAILAPEKTHISYEEMSAQDREVYDKYTKLKFEEFDQALDFVKRRGNGATTLDMPMSQVFYISDLVNEASWRGFSSEAGMTYMNKAKDLASDIVDNLRSNKDLQSFMRLNSQSGLPPKDVDTGSGEVYGRAPFYQLRVLATKYPALKNSLESYGWKF